MPVITVHLFEGRTDQQKRELVAAITDAFVRIGKTTPEAVHVIFHDVSKANWGHAGKLASDEGR
ncbi:MAG: 4-oxalocrotonate tautomerase family protein [Candidatus Methylomirabilia bacterium]